MVFSDEQTIDSIQNKIDEMFKYISSKLNIVDLKECFDLQSNLNGQTIYYKVSSFKKDGIIIDPYHIVVEKGMVSIFFDLNKEQTDSVKITINSNEMEYDVDIMNDSLIEMNAEL